MIVIDTVAVEHQSFSMHYMGQHYNTKRFQVENQRRENLHGIIYLLCANGYWFSLRIAYLEVEYPNQKLRFRLKKSANCCRNSTIYFTHEERFVTYTKTCVSIVGSNLHLAIRNKDKSSYLRLIGKNIAEQNVIEYFRKDILGCISNV